MKCLFAMAAAALALAAVAQDPAPDRPRQAPAGTIDPIVRAALNPKVSKKIGLTEEQQAKLKAVATSSPPFSHVERRHRLAVASWAAAASNARSIFSLTVTSDSIAPFTSSSICKSSLISPLPASSSTS